MGSTTASPYLAAPAAALAPFLRAPLVSSGGPESILDCFDVVTPRVPAALRSSPCIDLN